MQTIMAQSQSCHNTLIKILKIQKTQKFAKNPQKTVHKTAKKHQKITTFCTPVGSNPPLFWP
jgi:hypothetical protein